MDIWAKGPAAQDALYRQYRKLLQDMQVLGAGGGVGARGGGMGLPICSLWPSAAIWVRRRVGKARLRKSMAAEHPRRSICATGRRRCYSPEVWRGPSEEEWKARYYKGGFEGIDEKTAGLDELFGKPGTWDTLISEQTKSPEANERIG